MNGAPAQTFADVLRDLHAIPGEFVACLECDGVAPGRQASSFLAGSRCAGLRKSSDLHRGAALRPVHRLQDLRCATLFAHEDDRHRRTAVHRFDRAS